MSKKKKLSDALDDLAEAWDPEIGILEAATDPAGFVNSVAAELRDNRAEIARLRDVMLMVADCDPERDRPDCWEDGDCSNCMFWTSEDCDVDGWEPPE